MATTETNPKQQAHILIERMSSAQVSAVVGLLEAILDPVSVTLANAPSDDEPVSEGEAREIAEARESFARGEGVSHEEVLRDFGLSAEDFERLSHTHPEPDQTHSGQ